MGQAFRDSEAYLLRLDNVNRAIEEFQQVCDYGYDTVYELEHLMLTSYKLWNFIREYMIAQDIWFSLGNKSKLVDAMVSFLAMQSQWKQNGIRAYPLADEIKHLECISRGAYSILKQIGHIT